MCQEGVLERVDGPERRLGVALWLVREWLIRSAGVQGLCRPRWIQSRPWLPSRTASALPCGVGDEVAVDGVADASFHRADGGAAGHALSALAVVEPAAGAVGVAELGDRGDVDDVVQGPFPRRERRCVGRFGFPDDHSIGAVPL